MQTLLEHRGPDAGQPAGWQAALRIARERRARLLQQPPDSSLAQSVLTLDLEIARLAAALGERETLGSALCTAAGWGAAAGLCEWFQQGSVVLRINVDASWQLPAGANCLLPPEWMSAAACACLSRDEQALSILARPALVDLIVRKTQARAERVGGEAFWQPYCRLFAAVIRQEPVSPEEFAVCREQLRRADPGFIDPENLRAEKEPTIDLMQALASADMRDWNSLVRTALERFDAYYSQPHWATLDIGMLPLTVAALCALAHDRFQAGATFDVESPYLPAWLVRGEFERAAAQVAYEFPRRRATDAKEIHWALDLEGVPRQGREHRLIDDNGVLVARYELSHWAVVPRASAEFLLEEAEGRVSLLDAGELLLVSDLHAAEVDARPQGSLASLRRQRFHMREALDALEAVIALIPAESHRVPDDAFRSERGRALLRAEPGRFEAGRLRAVQLTYARILADIDARLQGGGDVSTVAVSDQTENTDEILRGRSLTLIELIKVQVTPILDGFAHDRSGDIVKLLRPRADDYAKVFVAAAIDAARQSYEKLWDNSLDINYPSAQQTVVRCHVAPAGMLATDNELSRHFPGGYRAIARWLNPHRVWVAWKYLRPGEAAGLAYDGLVWIDDHWAWFPKPYRILKLPFG